MYKCSFCDAVRKETRLPDEWGGAKIHIPGKEDVEITFCPLHRKEAERKLDIALGIKGE